jgi:hypothetical protein
MIWSTDLVNKRYLSDAMSRIWRFEEQKGGRDPSGGIWLFSRRGIYSMTRRSIGFER